MTINIYELHGSRPIEVWEDYQFVPNIGDYVSTAASGLKTVKYRVFRNNCVDIRITEL